MTSVYKSAEGERAVRERYIELLKHWPVPSQQLRVPTREGETFLVASGDENAPPLLLFHGSMANSAMWMGDIAAWAKHFRVYAVDMIGDAGLSAPSRPPLSSEAHALWLDDVLQALALASASLVGVSLGGWLALDYATRRPDRVESVAVLCPAGVGRQKISIVFKTLGLRMLGAWGRRKAAELVLGRAPANPSPAQRYFLEFFALIHKNFRRRMVKLPIFSDAALRRLTMPMLVVVGGKDVLIDSTETKRRLERNVPQAEIRYLPEAGHFIPGQTAPIRTSSVACLHLTSHKATSRDRSRRSDRGELAGLGVIGKNEYNVRAPHCEFGQPRYSERLRTGDGGRVPARGWKHATGPRLLSRNRPR